MWKHILYSAFCKTSCQDTHWMKKELQHKHSLSIIKVVVGNRTRDFRLTILKTGVNKWYGIKKKRYRCCIYNCLICEQELQFTVRCWGICQLLCKKQAERQLSPRSSHSAGDWFLVKADKLYLIQIQFGNLKWSHTTVHTKLHATRGMALVRAFGVVTQAKWRGIAICTHPVHTCSHLSLKWNLRIIQLATLLTTAALELPREPR